MDLLIMELQDAGCESRGQNQVGNVLSNKARTVYANCARRKTDFQSVSHKHGESGQVKPQYTEDLWGAYPQMPL